MKPSEALALGSVILTLSLMWQFSHLPLAISHGNVSFETFEYRAVER